MSASKLCIQGVRHSFEVEVEVEGEGRLDIIDGIDLAVGENEFVAVIGPSGSGKSTLFNVIAGLLLPDSGHVRLDGADITGKTGCVAYMMQKDLLLPWRTILDNVTLGAEIAGRPRGEFRTDARDLMRRFGLEGFESFYPAALSGGMRQRAALMRTILRDRQVLLLDEPFGALDALTRSSLQEWLLGIWQDFRRTIVLITHDPEEAVFLSDRIYVTTARPMRIKGIVEVPLARPRGRDTTASIEFARIKRDVLHLVTGTDDERSAVPVAGPRARGGSGLFNTFMYQLKNARPRAGWVRDVLSEGRHCTAAVRESGMIAPALILLGAFAVWEGAVRLLKVKAYILPPPSTIAERVITDWPILFGHLRVTLEEIALGFALAIFVSFTLGTLIAHWSAFRRGVYPLVIASQTIPIIAIAPVLVIWFGYNIVPRVLVTALITFFPLTVNVVTGFRAVDREVVDFFRSLNATPAQIFIKLSLPAALPYIFAGLKISATLAVIGATVSEWIGADRGLGYLIYVDTSQLDTVRVFSAISLLSLCGISLFCLIVLIERVALPWRYSDQAIGLAARLSPGAARNRKRIVASATVSKEA